MINTFKIYEELQKTLGEEAARAITQILTQDLRRFAKYYSGVYS